MARDAAERFWLKFERTLEAAGRDLVSVAAPDLHGSYWWGSSREFDDEVRREHPELWVDEAELVPLAGRPCWTPADEPPQGDRVRRGRTPLGVRPLPGRRSAAAGTKLYCPACCRVAPETELRLARQRKLAGPPPSEGRRAARPA